MSTYKVLKDSGRYSSITLLDVDTKSSIILGLLDSEIEEILNKEGYIFSDEDGSLKLTDKWELDISNEAGELLARKTMPIKRPIRNQKKTPSEQIHGQAGDKKQPVDVFNLIFGIED